MDEVTRKHMDRSKETMYEVQNILFIIIIWQNSFSLTENWILDLFWFLYASCSLCNFAHIENFHFERGERFYVILYEYCDLTLHLKF